MRDFESTHNMYQELLHKTTQDGFDIAIYACEEHSHPDDSYDWQDATHRKETLEWMEQQGLLGWFCAKVTASKQGIELGCDYLGGCSYSSTEEFLKDAYCEGMIDQAIDEAKQAIQKLTEG